MASDDDPNRKPKRLAPLQFGLCALLIATAVVAALFSTVAWLGVPEQGRFIILLVLGVSVAAAVGLLVAIANSGPLE